MTEILRVRHIDAAAAVETLRPLVSRDGSITAGRNSIIISDFADNVRRIRQVLASIDRDTSSSRIVTLQNAGAREIAASLNALMEGGAGGARPAAVVPIDSSNSIAIRGDAATVARLAAMAEELDQRAATGTEIRVVFLEHADAEQLLPVLQQLLGQRVSASTTTTGLRPSTTSERPRPTAAAETQTVVDTASGGSGAFGSRNAVVTRFEGANAIVIAAPTDIQRSLGEVIRQLDRRQQQVLVEAIIVEISDTAAKQLGVQLLLSGLKGSNIPFAVTNYTNSNPNILAVAGGAAAQEIRERDPDSTLADALEEAAVDAVAGATGGIAGLAIRSGNAIFGAIVNAVQSDSKSNLLATPSVAVIDNRPARFLAGQEVPVTTGEALSDNFDNAFRTVQRQNVGISLEVTPQINAGDTVKLEIRQEVSSIAGTVGNRVSTDLILNKREIETSIVVDDGEIVGIGGLLNDNERRTLEKIPVLGDIPVVGNLFKSRGRQREKTNLMVFIRPTILRSAQDARTMTERRYNYLRAQQYLQNPDREPSIDELVREYMGMSPPAVSPAPPPPLDPATYAPVTRPGDQVVNPPGGAPQ